MSIAEKFYREYFRYKYCIQCRNDECRRNIICSFERATLPAHYKCDICEQLEKNSFEFDTKPSDIKRYDAFPVGSKLELPDWKTVNMLIVFYNHILSKQKKFLRPGQIAVDKKNLQEHCLVQRRFIAAMDIIMKEPSTNERGKKIAHAITALENTVFKLQHYDLNIPMKKLKGNPIPEINNEFLPKQ